MGDAGEPVGCVAALRGREVDSDLPQCEKGSALALPFLLPGCPWSPMMCARTRPMEVEVSEVAEKDFRVTTTAQVERTYVVKGRDEAQAHKRLRTFLADPEGVREGLVTVMADLQIDATPQKVKTSTIKATPKPRAAKSADVKPETVKPAAAKPGVTVKPLLEAPLATGAAA